MLHLVSNYAMSRGKNREARHSFATAIVVLAMALLSSTDTCHSQGTLQITFDEPTPQPPGTAVLIQRYDESGMTFTPVGMEGFARRGGAEIFFQRMVLRICKQDWQVRSNSVSPMALCSR